jgi:hypothetical protein
MPVIDIKAYIDHLRQRLPYVPPVPLQKIKALHRKGDFGGVVKLIRNTMNVGVHLTIHWTSGPPPKKIPNANAWISLPETMPYYGTSAFKEQKLDIFILKSYRDASTYDEFARTVSHELSLGRARSHLFANSSRQAAPARRRRENRVKSVAPGVKWVNSVIVAPSCRSRSACNSRFGHRRRSTEWAIRLASGAA